MTVLILCTQWLACQKEINMKTFKLFLLLPLLFSLSFNFTFSQLNFDCTDVTVPCDAEPTVVTPAQVDCGNGFFAPTRASCPAAPQPTEVNCPGGYFSDYYQQCMKTCPGNSPDVRLNESCSAAPTGNTSSQPTPTTPVLNTGSPYQTPPYVPNNTGGVSVTCRGNGQCGVGINWGGANIGYNPTPTAPTYNQPSSPYWGGNSGNSQIYSPSPTYNTESRSCTSEYRTCSNGQAMPRDTNCTWREDLCRVNTIPTAPRVVCPVNYNVSGQECVPNKKYCADGAQVNFYEQCLKTCWSGTLSGQRIPENQSCPAGVINVQPNPGQTYNPTPVTTVNNSNQTKTCPGGYIAKITEACPAVPNWGGDSRPAQAYATTTNVYNTNVSTTKVCRDGNTVYDYQVCTKRCLDGKLINEDYRCPVAKANHEVITTTPTYITNSSASCNGVADIVNSANTTGYFEYGTSAQLGKTTNSGNIGYGDNIAYSNTITNLESDTKYYCRAVIVNKDGVYKGDIVSFRTSANKKVYVSTIIEEVYKKEIISSPVKKSITKKVEQKKVEITCKDTAGNLDKLESGEKFLDMRLDNVSGYISPSEITDYRLEYKNRSSINLENVLVAVKVPEGMAYVSSTDGTENDGEIIIKVGDLKANESKIINFKLKGDKNLVSGKNIIVQANSTYDMLDENGDKISDENSVYSISTVTDKMVSINNKISKETETFWSGWLFKFLLSIILLVILFVLGRNIYKKIIHKRHADRILGHH